MKCRYKQDIHSNIGGGGHCQKVKGRLGIPQSGENPRGDIIKEYKGQAPHIDIQIHHGIGKNFRRCPDQPKQWAASQNPSKHQRPAEDGAEDAGGGYGGFQPAVVPGAEELRDDDGTAHIAAEGKGNEDQGDFIAVTHGCQGVLSDELTGHQTVRNVVKLLKNDAAEQGKAEPPQYGFRFSYCQIFIHKIIPPMDAN